MRIMKRCDCIRKLLSVAAAILISLSMTAQKGWYRDKTDPMPVVNPDKTVTFRYYAPGADTVQVNGDFLQPEGPGPSEHVRLEEHL